MYMKGFKAHKIVDPLVEPGSADLTSNVNFTFIREALTNPRLSANVEVSATDRAPSSSESTSVFVPALQSQRSFLLSLGLQLRVQKLIDQSKDHKRREEIIKSAERLVDKNEKIHGMGKVFKVLGFVPKTGKEGGQQDVFPFGLELD
jgi:NADH dehydrogenase [ubiquinone] 1 alpha subcomplex assembly factor 7